VEDVGEALRRAELFDHHLHREADRIGDYGLVLRSRLFDRVDDRVGQVDGHRLLWVGGAAAQHVEGDATDDGGEPGAEVLDFLCL
jgi:hypothetical protein